MKLLLAKIEELVNAGMFPEAALRLLVKEYDPIIRVERSSMVYPAYVARPMHEELEKIGPSELNITEVKQLAQSQWEFGVAGNIIHEGPKNNAPLETCYGFAELLAIQARGIGFFRHHLAGKVLFGPKGKFCFRSDDLGIPCLVERAGDVVLTYCALDNRT